MKRCSMDNCVSIGFEQIDDILTKSLSSSLFHSFQCKLRVIHIPLNFMRNVKAPNANSISLVDGASKCATTICESSYAILCRWYSRLF